MYDIMQGIKVVEVASYLFVPVSTAILADWGASVIRVEHPRKLDPYLEVPSSATLPGAPNTIAELPNRGKRSVGVDITTPQGREIMYKLIAEADVFVTNMRNEPRYRNGLDFESVKAVNPRIVYARGSGYGPRGPLKDKPGFDYSAAWSRAGFLHKLTAADAEAPVDQPGSVGDLTGGLSLAFGMTAGLFARERTGQAQEVDASLYSVGMWIMSQSIVTAPYGPGATPGKSVRKSPPNPLANTYPTKDQRWVRFSILTPDPYWADFCEHVGRPDLIADPRFAEANVRSKHSAELVEILDGEFRSRTLEEWKQRLATLKGVWDPAQSAAEVAADPHVLENDYLPEVEAADGSTFRLVAAPVQFGGTGVGRLKASPKHGEHTEDVLRELGYGDADIAGLRATGVI